jgi:hypothetical protein
MKFVYMVTHEYEHSTGEEEYKIIGVYRTKHDAQLAVRRKRSKDGFRDYPRGFVIDRVEIGRDLWSEGFITYRYVPKKADPVGTDNDRAAPGRV